MEIVKEGAITMTVQYLPDGTTESWHEERLHEASRRRDPRDLIRDVTEQTPVVIDVEGGLIYQIKQWMQRRSQPKPQEAHDVRCATAV
jgi:hypothetical protein